MPRVRADWGRAHGGLRGFSRDSLASRIASAGATCVIAADGVRRGGKVIRSVGHRQGRPRFCVFAASLFVFLVPLPRHADAPWLSAPGLDPPRASRSRHATARLVVASDPAGRHRRRPVERRRGTRVRRSRAARHRGGSTMPRTEPELAADEVRWHDVVTSTDNSDVEWMAAEDPLPRLEHGRPRASRRAATWSARATVPDGPTRRRARTTSGSYCGAAPFASGCSGSSSDAPTRAPPTPSTRFTPTRDCGWITGPPTSPTPPAERRDADRLRGRAVVARRGRLWRIVDQHKVTRPTRRRRRSARSCAPATTPSRHVARRSLRSVGAYQPRGPLASPLFFARLRRRR